MAISPHYIHRMFGQGGVPPFLSTEILLSRSTNLGISWFDTIVVSQPDGYASIAPVISSRAVENGVAHIYTTWHDKQYGCGGLGCSIVFRKSRDEGQTWDDEIRLTEELNTTNSLGKVTHYGERVGAAWESLVSFLNDYPTLRYSLDNGENWFPLVSCRKN